MTMRACDKSLGVDVSRRAIAQQYGVSPQTIINIATRHTFRHVGGPDPAPRGPRSRSGYWGVTMNGIGNRFFVNLQHEGRIYSLGTYRDAESAARAYDAKARELGFPPERLNFPDEDS